MITVIGAGSGKPENLTLDALNKIEQAKCVILRTSKMPVAELLTVRNIPFTSLDFIYESAQDFDELNEKIKAELYSKHDCCYIVHGNALDDTSVQALDKDKIQIIPGISVSDCACAFMGITENYKAFNSAEVLAGEIPTPHTHNVITCIDSDFIASDIKCILSLIYGDELQIALYHEDYCGRQTSKTIQLFELDMLEEYNHTTSIYLPKIDLENVFKYDCRHLIEITDKLCSRFGCTWDSVQTHESLRPFIIEEAYEVVDTIDKNDVYALFDELGDVLFQVSIHSAIGKKSGEFDFSDVTDAICRKMINRHPELFPFAKTSTELSWEEKKMQERGLKTVSDVMHDVPEALPACAYAEKIQFKAEKGGIELPSLEQNILAIKSILDSAKLDEETLGKLLFECVALCKNAGVHPELALNKETKTYIDAVKK